MVTAFLVDSYKDLKRNSAEASLERIEQHLQMLNGLNTTAPNPLTQFTPDSAAVAVNGLWFLSLVLALVSAFLGIFIKEWLSSYMLYATVAPARDAVGLRHIYRREFSGWQVRHLRTLVQILLQAALTIFLIGLLIFVQSLDRSIVVLLSISICVSLIFAAYATITPVFSVRCPFKSDFSWIFAKLFATLKWAYFPRATDRHDAQLRNIRYFLAVNNLSPSPSTWADRDAVELLSRRDLGRASTIYRPRDPEPQGWTPIYDALARLLATSHDEGLIDGLKICISNLDLNRIELASTLAWKVLNFRDGRQLKFQLLGQLDYKHPKYDQATLLLQARVAALHPSTIRILVDEIGRALLSCCENIETFSQPGSYFKEWVKNLIVLLEVMIWTADNASQSLTNNSVLHIRTFLSACLNCTPAQDNAALSATLRLVMTRYASLSSHPSLAAMSAPGRQ